MKLLGTALKHLTMITLVTALTACVTTTESRLLKNKDPEKAVENYTQLGYRYLRENHPDLARKRLQKALSIDSSYAPANDAMGLLWQTEGEFDLAEEFLKKAVDYDADFTAAKHHLGRLYVQLKQFDQAEVWLRKSADDRYYENRPAAFNDLAMNFYRQGQPEKAIEAYQEVLRLAPYNAEALVNISTLLFEDRRYADADRYFTRLDRLAVKGTTRHSANSLWLGIRLATISRETARVLRFASELKQEFPNSNEYRLYQESLRGNPVN